MRPLVTPSAIRNMAIRGTPTGDDLRRRSVDRPIEEKTRSPVRRLLTGPLHAWRRVRPLEGPAEGARQVVELN